MKDPTKHIFIPANTFVDAFTQSEFDAWDTCAFKWYLKYGHRLDLKGGFDFSLMFGTAMHASIANFMRGSDSFAVVPMVWPEGACPTNEQEAKFEYMNAVLEATMEAYAQHYGLDVRGDFKVLEERIEEVVEVTIEYKGVTITLKGILDVIRIGKSKQKIWDHKSMGVLNAALTEAWKFRFQFMFYVWLAWNSPTFRKERPAFFMVNGVKKTLLRQKQTETLAAFTNRVTNDILARPSEYLWREEMEFDEGSIERFEKEHLFPKLDRIVQLMTAPKAMEHLAINKNTDACWNYNKPCAFLPICSNNFEAEKDRYTQRVEKHTNYNTIDSE